MKKFTAKKVLIFSLIILGVFLILSGASAQGLTLDAELGTQTGLFSGSLTVIVARLINAGLGILGLIAVMIVLYGGYLYMTARGEAERVQKAKKLLIQAVIGLLIIASAYAISSFVLYILTGGGGGGGQGNTNGVFPPACTGPECGKPPVTLCENPTPGSEAPYICSVKPAEQARGGILTIRGGNFGQYDTVNTPSNSKVTLKKGDDSWQAEIVVCPGVESSVPRWNNKNPDKTQPPEPDGIIKVIVPDNLPFVPAGDNDFKVIVWNGGQFSIDYHLDSDFTHLRNIFTLTDKAPSPEFICLVPNNAAEGTEVQVYGKFMGTADANDLFFNKDNKDGIVATSSSWTADKIVTSVPESAIYGEVYLANKTTHKESDGENFWVTCSNITSPYDGCKSKCCRAITSGYTGNVCDLEKYCGASGIGAKCSSATCKTEDPVCNAGLICDTSQGCTCRLPKEGDACGPTECLKDAVTCGQDFVCGQNCTCQVSPQITAVTPGNGASGNYITISGKGFGQPKLGNNVIPNSDFSKSGWDGVLYYQATQPPNVSPEPPSVLMTSISDGQLLIDSSKASIRSWYIMWGYNDFGKYIPNKKEGTQYLVSFKYKGNLPNAIGMLATAMKMGSAGCVWNATLSRYINCNSFGPSIPAGNYNDWQTYRGVLTYDAIMINGFAGFLNNGSLGFLIYAIPRNMKMYIDDFEVREIMSTGTVTFCGADVSDPLDNDKCGDADDKIAKLPYESNLYCSFDNDWKENEIIVIAPSFDNPLTPAPAIEPNVSGPIKVTTAFGLSAQTDPVEAPEAPLSNHSYLIPDFEYNTIKRPGLCTFSPTMASIGYNNVSARGNGFGTYGYNTPTVTRNILIGDVANNIQFGAWWVWDSNDSVIYNLRVPSINTGTVPVRVKVLNELSNPVSFKILAPANTPIIESIDPAQGPTGQYITIRGSGFGNQPGTAGKVRFWVSGNGGSATPYVYADGLYDFPEACVDKYWSDTQIIIKVPAGAAASGSLHVIRDADKAQSNNVSFNHCIKNDTTCPLTPGICSIVPDKAPAGTSNIVIWGDNFGTTQGSNNLIFSKDNTVSSISSSAWANQKIGATGTGKDIIVPSAAVSGPVIIKDSNGISSNKYNFDVDDCRKNPKVCAVPDQDYVVAVTVASKTANEITAFTFKGLTPEVSGIINQTANTISVTVPSGTDVTNLVPTIATTGVSVSPASGKAHDFTTPSLFTVTAFDSGIPQRNYTVTVNVATNPAKTITSFTIPNQVKSEINANKITITMPAGTLVKALIPTIVSPEGTVSPASGLAQDFTSPVNYKVTATGSPDQNYIVTVNIVGSPTKAITSFNLAKPPAIGVINEAAHTIDLTVPYGTDVTKLAPTIINTGASVSPSSGKTHDFTNPGIYTVTALGEVSCCQQTGACIAPSLCFGTGPSCEYRYTFKTAKQEIEPNLPEVVENSACDEDIDQSPSPWKDPANAGDYACINAVIYARFNQDMDQATLIADNIEVKSCSVINDKLDKTSCVGVVNSSGIEKDENSISFNPPTGNLTPATWYKVTLKGTGIKASTGKFLDGDKNGREGGDYVWYFRTQDSAEICKIETVNVTPDEKTLKLLSQTQVYNAKARAANCNILAGDFDWTWYTKTTLSGSREGKVGVVAKLTDITKLVAEVEVVIKNKQLATPLKQGSVYIGAEVQDRSDENNKLTVNLNLPEISGFYHKDGVINDQVNSYVDITGINFGETQGTNKVYFEKNTCAEGETSPCWTEAKLANCALSWTDTSVKVIVPKDVKNSTEGAWIKLVTQTGEDNTDGIMASPRVKNNTKDPGETFKIGDNLYPFICQLNPNFGSTGINVEVIGDNFGDKNKISYQNQDYQVGSYINFDTPLTPLILASSKIKSWSNTIINYTNPLNDLSVSSVEVFATIDPLSEPYLDKNNNGVYDCFPGSSGGCTEASDPYADTYIPDDNIYTKVDYVTDDGNVSNLESNRVEFSQPPVITSLSPNNGPVKQWVTIFGRNFGTYDPANSKVYFGAVPAALAPCETAVWTNNYIIAVVPTGAVVGKLDVSVTTNKGVTTTGNNTKPFIVNTNPLGAGLCSLNPLVGQVATEVHAVGVNFGAPQETSIFNFSPSVGATVSAGNWSDTNITGTINAGSESGFVTVIKKVVTGQKCAGFSIGSYCPGNAYEDVTQDVPSNGIYFSIMEGCVSNRYLGQNNARDLGFPVETYKLVGGARVPYTSLHVGPSAVDGTYFYSIPFGGEWGKSEFGEDSCTPTNPCDYYEAACLTKIDTSRTIWKIGTGYNGTNLGRVYKKYHFDYSKGTPFNSKITCTGGTVTNFEDYSGFSNIIATEKGDLYVARVFYEKNRWWLPHTAPNIDPKYAVPWWGVGKIKFDECPDFDCTFHIEYQEIPQGVVTLDNADWPTNHAIDSDSTYNLSIASNGTEIFALSRDLPGGALNDGLGYTIQVFNQDWVLKKQFTVRKAEHLTKSYLYQITEQYFTADNKYLYLIGEHDITAIDWQAEEFSGTWPGYESDTKELFGAYDWVNDKFWFGSWTDDNPLVTSSHSRIYRYSSCANRTRGFCRADSDCLIAGRCTTSECLNNQCTPEIISMNPSVGPVGQWVDIEGCYLGCDSGNVYFKGNTPSNKMPTNGLLAGYNFDSSSNNGWVGGSSSITSGSLNNATISGGVLKVPLNGFLDLDDKLGDPTTYNDGKMTLFFRFKTDTDLFWDSTNWPAIVSEVGGINQLILYPHAIRQIHFVVAVMEKIASSRQAFYSNANVLTAGQWNSLVVIFQAGAQGSLKYYVNGQLTNTFSPISNLEMLRNLPNSSIGSVSSPYQRFVGEIDDVYIYNRAFTDTEIAELFKVKALTPSDGEGSCKNTWKCSADLTSIYDQIKVEVPNKKTTITTDDATTGIGMVTLQTSAGNLINVRDFTVNTLTAPLQLCGAGALCGNGTINPPEECDGTNLNGKTCSSTGIDLGTGSLTCKANCTFDTRACSLAALCGNNFVDGSCSNPSKTTKQTCLESNKTWTNNACSVVSPATATRTTCLAGNNTWIGEQCDGNSTGALDGIFAPEYVFEYDEICTKYGELPSCIRKCSTRCKTLVCNRAGQDCSEPALCGNGDINGTCSNTLITTGYVDCINGEKDVYTWNSVTDTCDGHVEYTTKSACEADKNFWSGEQCDCGDGKCYNSLITTAVACVAPKTWSNNRCWDNSLNKDDCLAVNGNRWDWDCGDTLPTCSDFDYGEGNLGCNINSCKLNTSDCETAPDTTSPWVDKTSPVNGQGYAVSPAFCRNGVIDIYFSELLNPATITTTNFVLGSCTGGPLVKEENGLFNKAFAYIKNILFKLAGYKTQALAVEDNCDFVPFAAGDYTATYANINNTWNTWDSETSTCSDPSITVQNLCHCSNPLLDMESCHPKTVVYLELAETDIFAAHKTYNVKILPAVADKAGNQLDLSDYPSPMTITDGGETFGGYAFGFETSEDTSSLPGGASGICDIDTLNILVYHGDYDTDSDRTYVTADPLNPKDLFRCAGKNDCALSAVISNPPITADYDQDRQTSGNQHIYKANASSSANTGDFHLSMYAQWSRSDQSDPAKMLTLYNKTADSSPDVNIVRNTNGVVYTTINKIADKENTGLMVIEAQARGSQIDPEYRILEVEYLGCAYPWRFERDEYGNSKTWYCRDTGKDYRCVGGANDGEVCTVASAVDDCGAGITCQLSLPPAGILVDCSAVTNQSACSNSDMPDCAWSTVTGTCGVKPCDQLTQRYCSAPRCVWIDNSCQVPPSPPAP
jgi:hypothetical protein